MSSLSKEAGVTPPEEGLAKLESKPQKIKRTPKQLRDDNLKAYMTRSKAWTIEIEGATAEGVQEVWEAFLKDAERCPTRQPLSFFTPKVTAYSGFSSLGGPIDPSLVPENLPPLSTGLVCLPKIATSRHEAIRVLGSTELKPGMAAAIRFYKPGKWMTDKRAKAAAVKQGRAETRLSAQVAKAQAKHDALVTTLRQRTVDPAKGEFVKCLECGSRFPRRFLGNALPAQKDFYQCVVCAKDLLTEKDKERVAAAKDAIFALTETGHMASKDFCWLVRIGA